MIVVREVTYEGVADVNLVWLPVFEDLQFFYDARRWMEYCEFQWIG